jgi:hypothetical protein
MQHNLFLSILLDRDLQSLPTRLDLLEASGMSMDEEVPDAADDYYLPIKIVMEEICNYLPVSPYLEELLFWVTERTTPTEDLLSDIFHHGYIGKDPACVKAVDELLKRYEGDTLPFVKGPFLEMVLGYGYVNLEEFVDISISKFDMQTRTVYSTDYKILPIEDVMITYSLWRGCAYMSGIPVIEEDLESMIKLLKKYGSPEPSLERMNPAFHGRMKINGVERVEQRLRYVMEI